MANHFRVIKELPIRAVIVRLVSVYSEMNRGDKGRRKSDPHSGVRVYRQEQEVEWSSR